MKPHLNLAIRNMTVLAAGLCAAGFVHAQNYQFIDLGVGTANGINDLGQVVGNSNLGATLWNGRSEVGLVGGLGGTAWAINNSGQIVGNTMNAGMANAASWKSGLLTSLSSPVGASYAYGINDAGQIVGGSTLGATLWSNSSTANALSSNAGYQSIAAYGINASATIAGVSYSPGQSQNGTIWNGSSTILPNLSTDNFVFGQAHAINNAGIAVGSSTPESQTASSYAMEWKGTGYTELGTLGGYYNYANAINNAGLIVGSASDINNNPLATLWKGTTAIDLNSFLTPAEVQAGWVLTDATDINSKGWIVGDAYNNKTGNSDAFLLEVSPVPESGTWAMFAAGIALIAGFARRKRQPAADGAGLA